MDYSKTLNLPKTDFQMKANLPQKEPEILKFWEDINLYKKGLVKNKGKEKFILHDGPPYANGDIHMGHVLNKVLKDIVVKYKFMRGYDAPYVPGWDTHGLPIELQAIKKLGIKRNEVSPVEFRRMCKEYALSQINIQREQFKRLGVKGDWENPYVTLDPEYEARQIEIFGEMAKKGYIYKGLKSVYWCADCETALAEAEIEYNDKTSTSIYVKFKIKEDKGLFKRFTDLDNVYYVIWTTTPWTLPANVAICLNKDFEYSLIRVSDEYYIIAKGLLDEFAQNTGIQNYEEIATFKGEELNGQVAWHPFMERESVVILGEHVTLEAGTGCVHTAPGHGPEDFEMAMRYNLPVINPINEKGYFTEEAGKYKGMYYAEANEKIVKDLEETGYLIGERKIVHSYPHCWRCKNPVLFRATEQWFASVEGFREDALREIKNVRWIPEWGEERITNMVRDRKDWCISRQRLWGVPIPIFYCNDCGKIIINDTTINAVKEVFRVKGSDAWFELEAKEILPEGFKCECGSDNISKEKDIMDVWFDSGTSYSVLKSSEELKWPADLYLEGSDQHRGWFQSSLLTSVATTGRAPYKAVLTHGFVVDGEGRKMSKSLGNVINPFDLIKEYGADVLRLWVISADYRSDISISFNIMKQLSEVYRKIRNTARFLLGNLYDFDPDKDMVEYAKLLEIDKWALMKLQKLIKKVTEAYEDYEYHLIYHSIHNFCVVDMSNFYLDIIKDRVYTYKKNSLERRAAQTVMYNILNAIVKMIAPVLSFTAEEIWQHMRHSEKENYESVHLLDWPSYNEEMVDEKLDEKWQKIIDLRDEVLKALEIARVDKVIGHSLNAQVDFYPNQIEQYEFLKSMEKDLTTIFIVSRVVIHEPRDVKENVTYVDETTGLKVDISQAPGEKCERCWMYSETVGKNPEHPTICERCVNNLE